MIKIGAQYRPPLPAPDEDGLRIQRALVAGDKPRRRLTPLGIKLLTAVVVVTLIGGIAVVI